MTDIEIRCCIEDTVVEQKEFVCTSFWNPSHTTRPEDHTSSVLHVAT